MNNFNKMNSIFGKYLQLMGKLFADFFSYLFESYGWRGFLFRVFLAVIFFQLSTAGIPKYNNGPSGAKLLVISSLLLIYAIGKLLFDYSKVGRDAEAKKRNK